jgi:hypothetical protein
MLSLGLTILVWEIVACVAVPLVFFLMVWIDNVRRRCWRRESGGDGSESPLRRDGEDWRGV